MFTRIPPDDLFLAEGYHHPQRLLGAYQYDESPFSTRSEFTARKSFFKALTFTRRGFWLILIVFCIILCGTVANIYLTPPLYRADILLLIDADQSTPGKSELASGLISGIDPGTRELANQVLILQQSTVIAERTAHQLLTYGEVPETGEPLTILQTSENRPLPIRQITRRLHRDYIEVSLVNENEVDAIQISGFSTIPGEAALIANLFAEEYIYRSQEAERQRILLSRQFLEEQIRRKQNELASLEEEIERYMGQEGAVALDDDAQLTITQISRLEGLLDEARIDYQLHETSIQTIERELEQIHPRLVEHVASGVEQEISVVQKRIAELEYLIEQAYIRNPALRENPSLSAEITGLNSELGQLNTKVRHLSERYVEDMLAVGGAEMMSEGARSGIAQAAFLKRQLADEHIAAGRAQAHIQALETRIAQYEERLRTIPGQTMQLAQLKRDQLSTEQLYVQLSAKLQEIRIAEESQIGLGEIIRPALIPERPIRPIKTRILVLGTVLGLLLGFLAAYARYRLDGRIHTPQDVTQLGISFLSPLPEMKQIIRKEFGRTNRVESTTGLVSTSLLALLRPYTPPSEAYRRLFMTLQFSSANHLVRSILVTSVEAETGKSTLSLNLAITAAKANRSTLIVDADLHRPRLHTLLGWRSRRSLVDLLDDQKTALSKEDLATGIENLFAVTSPEAIAGATELLSSRFTQEFLDQLLGMFDLVILDSPPAMVLSDPVILSSKCDVTLIVARAGQTDASALIQTINDLELAGARIAGTVLNRFEPSRAYGYSKTYGYRYDRYYQT